MGPPVAPARTAGGLLRVLGLWFGVAAIIGNSIGVGILRTPSEVAVHVPTTVGFLAVWVAGGLYAALGVASMAELGVLMPRSGAQYVFAHEVFGPYAGFVIGWTDWISSCASAAAVSMVVAEYGGVFVGAGATAVAGIALGVVVLFTLVLWRGIRSSSRTVQLMTLAKVLALAVVPLVAFAMGVRAPAAPTVTATGAFTIAGVVLAMQSVIYSYDGWSGMLYFSGEVTNPSRDIPRAMFGGVAALFVIYMLLIGSYVFVLGVDGVAADTFPAGQVARALFGDIGDTIIRITVVITALSALPPIILMASRVPHAMSGDGLFPRRAAAVNPGGTPTVTLAASSLVAIGFIVSGTFSQVIGVAAFFFVLQYVMSFSAVFALRWREPDRPRPYRAIGYPVTTAISWLGGVAFLVGAVVQDHRNSAIAIGLLVVSYPVYRFLKLPRATAPSAPEGR